MTLETEPGTEMEPKNKVISPEPSAEAVPAEGVSPGAQVASNVEDSEDNIVGGDFGDHDGGVPAETTQQEDGDIEEGKDQYRPGGLHPVYIGDVFNERYEVLRKIGWGRYSTVWLVKDTTKRKGDEGEFRALKVLSAESYNEARPIYEREILTHLREEDRSHPGYKFICHLIDDFKMEGPNGIHVCLVFELMGETLDTYRTVFENQMTPNLLMRKFTYQLLLALDYAHDSGIIHTDIKPGNIFVRFRDRTLIESYLEECPAPSQDRAAPHYFPIESQSLQDHYFKAEDAPIDMDLALGDWGVSSWTTEHLSELIQPVCLRAPEVIIRAPWDWTTDWWNLGVVILEIFRGVAMFTGRSDMEAPYDPKTHLSEMVDLFGPFPQALLTQGDQDVVSRYFEEDGTVKEFPYEAGPGLDKDFYMEDLKPETRKAFLSFLYTLMKLNPAERVPTQTLIDHEWIRRG